MPFYFSGFNTITYNNGIKNIFDDEDQRWCFLFKDIGHLNSTYLVMTATTTTTTLYLTTTTLYFTPNIQEIKIYNNSTDNDRGAGCPK